MLFASDFLTKLSSRWLLLLLIGILGATGLAMWGIASFFPLHLFLVAGLGAIQYFCIGVVMYVCARRMMRIFPTFLLQEKIVTISALIVWMWFGVGIFLPEIGFDALWYHLPIALDVVETGRVSLIPDLYQSLQPKLGALLFVPSLQFFGTIGVKVFVYYFSTVCVLLVYYLARRFVPRLFALISVLIFISLHTISWQSTSAYVDIIRASFELSAVLLILTTKKTERFTRTDVGIIFFLLCFLLTKSVSLLFFLPYLFLLFHFSGVRKTLVISGVTLILFFCAQMNGSEIPLFSFYSQVSGELIGTSKGSTEWFQWGIGRVETFITLPLWLSFHRESYTSPLFLVSVPFLVLSAKKLWNTYRAEVLFTLASAFIWCLVVPISVRYGIVVLSFYLIGCVSAFWLHSQRNPKAVLVLLGIALLGALMTVSVRGYVYLRALPYLTGRQSEIEYVRQFKDGVNTGPIEKWYGK